MSDDKINEMVGAIFSPLESEELAILSDIYLDNVAWHDFAQYQYLLDPIYLPELLEGETSPELLSTIQLIADEGVEPSDIANYGHYLESALWGAIQSADIQIFLGEPNDITIKWRKVRSNLLDPAALTPDILATLAEIFYSLAGQPSIIYEEYWAIILGLGRGMHFDEDRVNFIDNRFFTRVASDDYPISSIHYFWLQVKADLEVWIRSVDTNHGDTATNTLAAQNEYEFKVLKPKTWNLGLRLVYRQEWRPLGNQRGEIIKTIPLGPKQAEKISTKIVQRTKVTRSAENLKSTEVTTETSDTTKDSSEVVTEAATTHNWEIKADGSFNVGIGPIGFGGTVDGPSYGGTTTDASKETSSHLSELMQKTASKIKTESKVIISTESESEFEISTSSEIHNPNEEIALTFVYSKLQRQYEIFTSLAECHNVVMIAEPIPQPSQISEEWIKKYDWIIAKALLDDSFRDILTLISEESPARDISTTKIDRMMDKAIDNVATLATKDGSASLDNVDVIQEAQRAYRDSHKDNIERQRSRLILEGKKKRLIKHIYDNILHYCRAIWSHEDPQKRILRYRKMGIKIPLDWQFLPASSGAIDIDDNFMNAITADPNIQLDGEFVAVAGGKEVDFADLINPAGPIDFYGNYSIYYIRPEYASEDMFQMFHFLKSPYIYHVDNVLENQILVDPYLKKIMIDYQGKGPQDINEKLDMINYVPSLRLELAIARNKGKDSVKQFLENDEMFKLHYAEYIFRKEQSRRFLLDTNNVMIDLLRGDGSALETFKLAHRGIDVLKANQERRKLVLENERRKGLIDTNKYFDPDVEKVVVVNSSDEQMALIASNEAASESTGSDDTGNE